MTEKYEVILYEIRKLTFHVELEDLSPEEMEEYAQKLSAEERAELAAVEGNTPVDDEFYDLLDHSSWVPEGYRPKVTKMEEKA